MATELIVLTKDDAKALARCEATIERGQETFLRVGQALAEIRDGKLYRATHKRFEDYCQERWSFQRNYANKLIQAAKTVDDLGTTVPTKPSNEAQARELGRLPEAQRGEAWQQAVERHGS